MRALVRMKLSNLCTGFAVSFALGTVPTVLAARMSWSAFGPRGRAALCGLVVLGAVIGVACRWLGRRSTGSQAVCKQLAAMTSTQVPLFSRFDESRHHELSFRINDLLTCVEDMLEGARKTAQDVGIGAEARGDAEEMIATLTRAIEQGVRCGADATAALQSVIDDAESARRVRRIDRSCAAAGRRAR